MRKLSIALIFLILPLFANAQDIAQPEGWVNDFAGVISPEYKEKLNALISELQEKTSAEIAVVTVTSISPYDEIEYARLLFDNWKPGKKGKDNGVLVLLAIKERRWRIETGYGVEGILPDGLCGEIGRNYMVPYFKGGKFSEGLYNGVARIAGLIAKDAETELNSLKGLQLGEVTERISLDSLNIILSIVVVFLLAPFLFAFILANKNRSGYDSGYGGWGYGSGGGFGGGGFGGFGGGSGGGGGAGGGF